MKTKNEKLGMTVLFVFLTAILCLAFGGCANTSYERGQVAAIGAVIAFDAPEDMWTLEEIKLDIAAFLRSDRELTQTLIDDYAFKIAEKLDKNPVMIRLVLQKLRAELDFEGSDKRAREFLLGVNDALEVVGLGIATCDI